MGNLYVRRAGEWVLASEGGAGGGPGGGGTLLETVTFVGGDLTGWTVNGSWSESPTDWITASGDGSGGTWLRRTLPMGTTYVEVDAYTDSFSDNWIAVRPWDPSGIALYDNGGPGWLVRGDGNVASAWGGGSDAAVGAGDLTGAERIGTSSAAAKAIGVLLSPGESSIYVAGVLRKTQTGQTDYSANTQLTIGCYNGISGHFHEVRCYDGLP